MPAPLVTHVPFIARHPASTFMPYPNVEVAVVEVEVIHATVGDVELVRAFVPPDECIQPCPKVVAPVPPFATPTVPKEREEAAEPITEIA